MSSSNVLDKLLKHRVAIQDRNRQIRKNTYKIVMPIFSLMALLTILLSILSNEKEDAAATITAKCPDLDFSESPGMYCNTGISYNASLCEFMSEICSNANVVAAETAVMGAVDMIGLIISTGKESN